MATSSKSGIILLFLVLTGLWLLGERAMRVLRVVARGIGWVIHTVWDLGTPTLPAKRKKE